MKKKFLLIFIMVIFSILLVSCTTQYQVTFDSNGGSDVLAQKVKSGEKIIEPENPTKANHYFVGWYLNDLKFDFENTLDKDVELVAKWLDKDFSSNVVISKLFTASKVKDNVIELYNNGDEDEDLSLFKLNFYQNGSDEITTTINLSGTIKANSYFTIAGAAFSVEKYQDLIDFTYSEDFLPYNGDDVIELFKYNKAFDTIGHIGYPIEFSTNLTLIRLGKKEDYKPTTEYDWFSYISYVADVFQYLKNDSHKIQTLEDLYNGPKLEVAYKLKNYSNGQLGTGGAVRVKDVLSVADGDTATFLYDGKENSMSHRYYYIDTPEVDGGNVEAEPWGYVASKLNKEYILNDHQNKEIYVQSIPNYSLTETYGRNIGLIWINGSLSQFLTVREGLSTAVSASINNIDRELTSDYVPYIVFLRFAEERARINGWGLHGYPKNPDGDVAPDWDFVNDKKNPTFEWEPHLPMPWDN